MSTRPAEPTRAPEDDKGLLRALGELPTHADDAADAERRKELARAAFTRAFAAPEESWGARLARRLAAAAVPVVLAGVTLLYLSWAIGAAAALVP